MQFVIANAVYSLTLVVVLGAIIWYKMHLLRMEIHELVERLPKIGAEFIREEISDLRDAVDQTRARVSICEERIGINGEGRGDG